MLIFLGRKWNLLERFIIAGFESLELDAPLPGTSFKSRANTNPIHVIKEIGKFTCSWCNKSFKHYPTCRSHTFVHTGQTTCYICNRVFAHRSDYVKHSKIHGPINLRCNQCYKVLSTELNLQKHMLSKHNM